MAGNKNKIFVVDDELNIRELIGQYLQKEGYEVSKFSDGESTLEECKKNMPDMIITDVMMPGMDGYTLCKEIRRISNIPILMVSARDDEVDKIIGLEIGGDDYISKPFSPRELIARVRTIFRRSEDHFPEKKDESILIKDITILIEQHRVLCNDKEVVLTAKEFELLTVLCRESNKVHSREDLITKIWGYDYIGDTRVVDDLVKRIRKKLAEADAKLEISTIWGYGYKVAQD